jgi:hypothetical protein
MSGMLAVVAVMGAAGGASVPRFKHGETKNYATAEDRAATEAYNYNQRAKGGLGYGEAGWNSAAAGDPGFRFQKQNILWGNTRPGLGPGGSLGGKGGTVGGTGWTPQGAATNLNFNMQRGTKAHAKENYPLGQPSAAWIEKFGNAPTASIGWMGTLTRNTNPQSTFGPSQMFKNEVYQTRETRRKGGHYGETFANLPQHLRRSRLHPNLAFMYKENKKVDGSIRRATRRLL